TRNPPGCNILALPFFVSHCNDAVYAQDTPRGGDPLKRNESMQFAYSDTGLALTKSFEGLQLSAYPDQGGVWTVGYGHTGPDVHAGLTITRQQADMFLHADLAAA